MTHLFSCSPPLLPLLLLLHKCLYSPALLFTARVGAVRAQPVCPRGTETGPNTTTVLCSAIDSPAAGQQVAVTCTHSTHRLLPLPLRLGDFASPPRGE